MSANLKIQTFKGEAIIPFIPELAKLRIHIFKEYPYLYEGDLEYEQNYLQTYIECPESLMVLVFDHQRIVGASTAIPLEFEKENWHEPFIQHHIAYKDIFYLGESLLYPEYRGQGLYKIFFAEREKAAKHYGSKIAAFAAVDRPSNHPLKPANYSPLDEIWHHFGYQRHPELTMYLEWQEINESHSTPKPLTFWLKNL